jgi:hypothetical protein
MSSRFLLLPLALAGLLGMAPDPITLFLAGDSTMAEARLPPAGNGLG